MEVMEGGRGRSMKKTDGWGEGGEGRQARQCRVGGGKVYSKGGGRQGVSEERWGS